jgi:hypothetical protein
MRLGAQLVALGLLAVLSSGPGCRDQGGSGDLDGDDAGALDAWDGADQEEGGGEDAGDGGEDGEEDGGDPGCPPQEPHERYCINPNSEECDWFLSWCNQGLWSCDPWRVHPPSGDAFWDWAWRCEVVGCNAQVFRVEPGPDWQEERPYAPPDPGSLTGDWVLWADNNDVVPLGCERRPRQYVMVQSLAVHPQNPDVMYIGMKVEETGGVSIAAGVYKSVDGGLSWFTAWAGIGGPGYDTCPWCTYGPTAHELYVDPADPRVVFASTDQRGLYWSQDGGAHWRKSLYADGQTWLRPGQVRRGLNGVLYHTIADAFFRWNSVREGFEIVCDLSNERGALTLVPDPVLPDRVWLGMGTFGSRSQEGPILRSDDAGRTWREMGHQLLGEDERGQNVLSLAICLADPAQMAAAVWLGGIYLSHDGGESWSPAGPPVAGRQGQTVAYASYPDRCVLYAGNRDWPRMFRTEDGGQTWSEEGVTALWHLAFNPHLPEMAFGILPYPYGERPFELWVRR